MCEATFIEFSTSNSKTTKCCDKHGPLHIKCISKLSCAMDVSYNFDVLTYADDESMSLNFFLCEKSYFYCGKKRQLGQKHISVDVCIICKKSWCYFPNKCRNKFMAIVCVNFNKEENRIQQLIRICHIHHYHQ